MNTKQSIDYIISICKQYIDEVLRGWGLSDEEKSLVAFEQKHMPYTQYSGNQSIDHVLFRKFLRFFANANAGGGTMEESFTTNMAIGGITSGTTIEANTKISEVLRNMLFAYIKPTPTITVSQSTYEVGGTASPTITYKATNSSSARVTKIVLKKGDTTLATKDPATSGKNYSYEDSNVTSNTTYSIAVYDDVKGEASNNTKEVIVSFRYKYFYGSQDGIPTNARDLTGDFSRPSSVNMDSTKWFLYVPKSYTQPTSFKTALETYAIEDENDSNQDKKGVILKKEVTVKDAGGNDAEYYRYMMQLDNPLGSNINIG